MYQKHVSCLIHHIQLFHYFTFKGSGRNSPEDFWLQIGFIPYRKRFKCTGIKQPRPCLDRIRNQNNGWGCIRCANFWLHARTAELFEGRTLYSYFGRFSLAARVYPRVWKPLLLWNNTSYTQAQGLCEKNNNKSKEKVIILSQSFGNMI